MKNYFVWVNGDFVLPEQAPKELFEHNGENDISVERDFRIYDTDSGPAIFRLTEHIRQFLELIRKEGFEIHLSEEQLCETIIRTLMYNQMRDGIVRTRLLVKKNWDENAKYRDRDDSAFVLAIILQDFEEHPLVSESSAIYDSGVVLQDDVPTHATLFLVKNNTIRTPPSRIFGNSLVRGAVITLAKDLGYDVKENQLNRKEIVTADEVFISTAVGEIQFVSEFNSQTIRGGTAGPVTRSMQSAFYNTMLGRGERSREWLEWVGATFLGL